MRSVEVFQAIISLVGRSFFHSTSDGQKLYQNIFVHYIIAQAVQADRGGGLDLACRSQVWYTKKTF